MNNKAIIHNLPLLILTLLCVLFIHFLHAISSERISDNQERAALQDINEVITITYDNDVFADTQTIAVPTSINPAGNISAYYARQNGQVKAIALLPIVAKGYSGPISLLVGMNIDGSISGVHVMSHTETPGFGANIHQDKSDWLTMFNGQTLLLKQEDAWRISADGGKYDRLSGATITSRAVISSLYELLKSYNEQPETFLMEN